jgi:hypothetical protein
VASREVAEIKSDIAEGCAANHLALRNEAIGDTTLIKHLDRAYVQSACAQTREVLTGTSLDNGNVNARQSNLACQHQPCWAASGDYHRMFGQ